jgi:hypothetical protein
MTCPDLVYQTKWQSGTITLDDPVIHEQKLRPPTPFTPFSMDLSFIQLATDNFSVSFAVETTLNLLVNLVQMPTPADLRSYLTTYPRLLPLLSPICQQAKRTFPHPSQLILDINRDPEIDDRYLLLLIRQPEYSEIIRDEIETFRQPWQEKITATNGYLLVTTDYQLPLE